MTILMDELLSMSDVDKLGWLIYGIIYFIFVSLFTLGCFVILLFPFNIPNKSAEIYNVFKKVLEFIVFSILGLLTIGLISSIIIIGTSNTSEFAKIYHIFRECFEFTVCSVSVLSTVRVILSITRAII